MNSISGTSHDLSHYFHRDASSARRQPIEHAKEGMVRISIWDALPYREIQASTDQITSLAIRTANGWALCSCRWMPRSLPSYQVNSLSNGSISHCHHEGTGDSCKYTLVSQNIFEPFTGFIARSADPVFRCQHASTRSASPPSIRYLYRSVMKVFINASQD